MDKRPKRTSTQKKTDQNEGLLWQEERDLTRALYASLQRPRSEQDADLPADGQEQPYPENPFEVSNGPENHVEPEAPLPDHSAPLPLDATDEPLGEPMVSNFIESSILTEPLTEPLSEPLRLEEESLMLEDSLQAIDSLSPVLDAPTTKESVDQIESAPIDHQDNSVVDDPLISVEQPKVDSPVVKKKSHKPKEPRKEKGSSRRKDSSNQKEQSTEKKSHKAKGASKSKQSGKEKKSHKKRESPRRLESLKGSSAKPEPLEPIVTRSRSPKGSSPSLPPPKPKTDSSGSSESIAHRLRASVAGTSPPGAIMGNAFRLSRPQERVPSNIGSAVGADSRISSDECRNLGEFLPPPPLLPPPLQPLLSPPPPHKHKSNAAVHAKKPSPTNKKSHKKSFAVIRDSRGKFRGPKTVQLNGTTPKVTSVPKRPLRSLRRDLRSRSKFKMPQTHPANSATDRRITRHQAALSSTSSQSSSSAGSSSNDSQDETKSTSSSSSSKGRQSKHKKFAERPSSKRKSYTSPVSSTSADEEDTKDPKPKRTKVQAQRKFAYPQAYSPGCTPSKIKNGESMSSSKACSIFNHCPTTEDFLTFLCLRGTPALPPILDLFKVQSRPALSLSLPLPPATPKHHTGGRKRTPPNTLNVGGDDLKMPGIEPLPATPTATPPRNRKTTPPRNGKTTPPRSAKAAQSVLQQKMLIRERRLRLDCRQFTASGKLTKNLRNSFKSNQNNIVSGPRQQLPPDLTPVPPPIPAVQGNRHPPPLIPIVPWENKRCQTKNNTSSSNAREAAGKRKSSATRPALARSSGRSSRRNSVPSKQQNNHVNHKLAPHRSEGNHSHHAATSIAKNGSSRKKENPKNNLQDCKKRARTSQRLKMERCTGDIINGSNHFLHKLDSPPNGHTLLSHILKGSRRERKEKKCSCHSQNCALKTRSRHKNGDRDLAIEGAIQEVLKTAKRQKKLKEFKRRSSRKMRNSPMMLRDRVQAAEVELNDSLLEETDPVISLLTTTNGISKKLTIPLTNCTLNNNVLRKDSMVCPKAHLNHEMEQKLTELKIKEDEEVDGEAELASPAARKADRVQGLSALKNHKEISSQKAAPDMTQPKLPKKAPGQSPRRTSKPKAKDGPVPSKMAKPEEPVGPSKYIEGCMEGLVLRPSAEEWSDPMAFLESVADQLNVYGMCRVIPPEGWKPECKLPVNTRFTTEVQYIHRLMHRWKSRSKQLACIKRHLEEKDKVAYNPPHISGCEIDLVEFSQVVAQQGGLKAIHSNKRWNKVADILSIPKSIHGRVSRLDSIYCKNLLSFDMLSKEDKQRLEIETEMLRKQQVVSRLRSQDNEVTTSEEVVVKGRPTTLTNYRRMADLTQEMKYARTKPTLEGIEADYWKMVDLGEPHVSIHTGQLNAALTARHNWNCKNVGRNVRNVLHLLPSRLGVNTPELKFSMLYGSEGWAVEHQGLTHIEYLHTGSPKIWYGVPAGHCNNLDESLQSEVPDVCTHQPHCLYRQNLHCMVPPSVLSPRGVPVYRLVQSPGEFIIVGQGAARATLCTGYSMSEGIPCAMPEHLQLSLEAFEISRTLKQPTLFSVEHLLCALATNAANNTTTNPSLLRELHAELTVIRDRELSLRYQLFAAGLKSSICCAESEASEDGASLQAGAKSRNQHASEKGCHVCRQHCYLSMVVSEREDRVFCLQHALHMAKTKTSGRTFKLLYRYSESQLRELVASLNPDPTSRSGHQTSLVAATPPTTAATTPTTSETAPTTPSGSSPPPPSQATPPPTPTPTSTSPLPPPPKLPPPSQPPSVTMPLSPVESEVGPIASDTHIIALPPSSSSPSISSANDTVTMTASSESRLRKKVER